MKWIDLIVILAGLAAAIICSLMVLQTPGATADDVKEIFGTTATIGVTYGFGRGLFEWIKITGM